jgi:SEC-C motif-containing protein
MHDENFTCPCRAARDALPYAACCGRYHAGPLQGLAPTAEDLMRSRYSAFVLDRLDYLLQTWHPSTRPTSLEPNPAGMKWLGLEVKRHVTQGVDRASVEFIARNKLGGRAQRLHETSRFVRDEGRWFYVDGETG